MHPAMSLPTPPARRNRTTLAVMALGVLLAHGALLHGVPMAASLDNANSPATDRVFSTRTIAIAPLSAPAVAPLPELPRKRLPALAAPNAAHPVSAEVFEKITPVNLENTVPLATQSIAPATPPMEVPVQVAAATQSGVSHDGVAAAANSSAAAANTRRYAIPGPARLKYTIKGEVKGFPYHVNGDLLWQHDESTYFARLEISHFLLGSRVQTSKGELGPQGLAPTRFGDKVRSEVAAHFERAKGKVSFSANTPDAPLLPGAQDQLSVFMQLASMVGGDPDQFSPGSKVGFQAIGPRTSEQWEFVVGGYEMLNLPGGSVRGIKLTREPGADFDSRAEIWLAPEMGYLPVRIRLTQANGDFADQLWRATETP